MTREQINRAIETATPEESLEKLQELKYNTKIRWDAPSKNKTLTNRITYNIFEGALKSIIERNNNPTPGFGAKSLKDSERLTIKNMYNAFGKYM